MWNIIVLISLFLLVYHYILYPVLVVALAQVLGGFRKPGQSKERNQPL